MQIEQIADFLTDQRDEPWPGGTESDRLHYWRNKAIAAARDLQALSARPAGDYVLVREIETVTGDFCTEPGEPFYRIEIDGFCADFDYREAADNFAAAINARIAARPAVAEDVVERIVDAVIDAANIVSHDGYYEIDRDAATRAAIAAMNSADMGKGGEG